MAHNKRCSSNVAYIYILSNVYMPGVSRLCISMKNPFSLFNNEVAPLKFNVIFVKQTTDAPIKYNYIKNILSDYHIGHGFYSLSAYDPKISHLFHLMDDAYSIQCNCKNRLFNVGLLDSDNNYVQLSNYYGMKVKDVAHTVVDKYNSGSVGWKKENTCVKKIIISENTPDQGLRYFTYVLNGKKLCKLDQPANTTVEITYEEETSEESKDVSEEEEESEDVSEDAEDDAEDSEDVENAEDADDAEDAEDDAEDAEDDAEDSEDADDAEDDEVAEDKPDNMRGDDPGDITNCLNTGDIIIHSVGDNTWYGCYNARTNTVYNSLKDKANRGIEACPIQDFAVTHLYDCSVVMKQYDDNLWTQCFVMQTNPINGVYGKYPILECVHRYFNFKN